MNAQITIETVTPQIAAEWLAMNLSRQRQITEDRVIKMAAEMAEGRWKLSSDAITFLKGELANGQHRLSAVIRAHKSAQFLVLRSSDIGMFDIIDSGKSRTVGDVLMVENSNIVTSIARLVLSYDKDLVWRYNTKDIASDLGTKRVLTRNSMIEFANSNLDILSEIAKKVKSLNKTIRILPPSVSSSLVFIASRKNKKRALYFKLIVGSSEFPKID